MLYYKIPITDGHTDCSAGSILCCAYPLGDYMVCEFESVAKVGPNWVRITKTEFEANCPDFPSDLPEDEETDVLKKIDYSNLDTDGTWTETMADGTVYNHKNTYDANGRPIAIDDIEVKWGDS